MASKPKLGERTTFSAGIFNGVQATNNPIDDQPNLLTDTLNGYFPDPLNGSEFASRPGCTMTAAPTTNMTMVGDMVEVLTNGTRRIFALMTDGGSVTRLYRASAAVNPTWTDVSPSGITLSISSPGKTFLFPFNGQLIVTDSVNQPWVGTNLGNTPITGTLIPIDTANDPWVAIGAPTLYVDSLIFICATTVANATGGICIVWCEPNQPLVGYMQSGYADFWNLIQTGTEPLFCVQGTNSGLYFARQFSWGVAVGTPSVNFSTTATQDTVSYEIGCVAAKSVRVFGNYIYFVDQIGRPYRMAIGGTPEPIWLRLRSEIEAEQLIIGNAASTFVQNASWGVIEPTLQKYICFPWAAEDLGPSSASGPTGYVFDALTGSYEGRWRIADWANVANYANAMLCGCIVTPLSSGTPLSPTLAMLGDAPNGLLPGHLGTYWLLQGVAANVWMDGTAAQANPVLAQTQRLGYSASIQWNVETVRAVTANQTPVALTIVGTNGDVGPYTSTPPLSNDGSNLAQWAPVQASGRGIQLQLSPTTTTSQWRLFRAEADMTGSVVQMSDG